MILVARENLHPTALSDSLDLKVSQPLMIICKHRGCMEVQRECPLMTVTVIRAVYCVTIFNFCFLWKVFHCVHFECPANQKEPSICGSDRTNSRSKV